MFNKLNNHLITHYPLLWNTRVVWVIACSLVIHLFFFLAGYLSIDAKGFQHLRSFRDIGGSELYTFSILCSMAVIISWLIFYLRNNAFKSFYILHKFHSAREYFYICLIFFLSVSYFDSYQSGTALKTSSITSVAEFQREQNIVNLASAFVPLSKEDYFILDSCTSDGRSVESGYNEATDYYDTTNIYYNDTDVVKVRNALKLPGAFSYKNYCESFFISEYKSDSDQHTLRLETWGRWIALQRTDSIRMILEDLILICRKYNIKQRIDPATLTNLVFKDSLNSITRTYYSYDHVYGEDNKQEEAYLVAYSLSNALEFVDEMHYGNRNFDDVMSVTLYFVIAFATFLLCYRLYSKRVFLISTLGSIGWSIIFILVGLDNSGDGVLTLVIILCPTFLLAALVMLNLKQNKTITGALLNWHIYLLPLLVLAIIGAISSYYNAHSYHIDYDFFNKEKWMKEHYPISHWVKENSELLIRLNLLFVFLYIGFFFTRLAKKWHIMPEE